MRCSTSVARQQRRSTLPRAHAAAAKWHTRTLQRFQWISAARTGDLQASGTPLQKQISCSSAASDEPLTSHHAKIKVLRCLLSNEIVSDALGVGLGRSVGARLRGGACFASLRGLAVAARLPLQSVSQLPLTRAPLHCSVTPPITLHIQVVGVGGGGSNAVNRMLETPSLSLSGVELWITNTDVQVGGWVGVHITPPVSLLRGGLWKRTKPHTAVLQAAANLNPPSSPTPDNHHAPGPSHQQALEASPIDPQRRLQIGRQATRGLGAGGNPDVGQVCAAAGGF